MTAPRSPGKSAATARDQVLALLKDDHKRVKKDYKDFQKLEGKDPQAGEAIVRRVLEALRVHSALEEEMLYPAARQAIKEKDMVDEAEVEHEALHRLMEQLGGMSPSDEKFSARFTVLCEYLLHHVKEEEGELFPQLEQAKLDWEDIAGRMLERRQQLAPGEGGEPAAQAEGGRSTAQQAARRGTSDDA